MTRDASSSLAVVFSARNSSTSFPSTLWTKKERIWSLSKVNLKRSPGGDNDGGKAFETRSCSYSGPRDLCHKFDLDSGVMIIMWLINGTHLSITITTYFWTMNPSRAVRSLSCLRVAIISNSCFVFFSVSASYLISLATNCFLVLLSEQFLTTAYLPLAMDRRKKLTDSAQ